MQPKLNIANPGWGKLSPPDRLPFAPAGPPFATRSASAAIFYGAHTDVANHAHDSPAMSLRPSMLNFSSDDHPFTHCLPGEVAFTTDSLTMTTGVEPSRSSGLNILPAPARNSITRKYLITSMDARRSWRRSGWPGFRDRIRFKARHGAKQRLEVDRAPGNARACTGGDYIRWLPFRPADMVISQTGRGRWSEPVGCRGSGGAVTLVQHRGKP